MNSSYGLLTSQEHRVIFEGIVCFQHACNRLMRETKILHPLKRSKKLIFDKNPKQNRPLADW